MHWWLVTSYSVAVRWFSSSFSQFAKDWKMFPRTLQPQLTLTHPARARKPLTNGPQGKVSCVRT